MNSNIPHWLKVVSGLFLLACLLPGTAAAKSTPAKLSVEYVYALDGTLTGRVVNGRVQNFEYDRRGQLLAVKDAQGNDLERYVYDPAGNILSKTVHGRTTRFTYDAANQITSRTDPDGSVIRYQYDAAGRLAREGNRTYHYGWQDKVEEIRKNGKTVARFTYGLDGQLESVTRADGSVEHFYWDGLALIGRGKSTFLNEPYVTGGNPIASDGKAMLNDMLGSTVGIRDGEKMTPVAMTAFGESADPGAMYTGKPHVDGLGYAFLFRNYRAELGKWQTADPLGYPDGWNVFAYLCNRSSYDMDLLGFWSFLKWLYTGSGNASDDVYDAAVIEAATYLLDNYDNAHINATANLVTGVGGTIVNLSVKYSIVNGAGVEFNVGTGAGFDIMAGVSVGVTQKVVKSQNALLDIISGYGFDVSVGGTFCFRASPVGYYILLSYVTLILF